MVEKRLTHRGRRQTAVFYTYAGLDSITSSVPTDRAISPPVEAKSMQRYRLHFRSADGAEGEVVRSRLAGRGVFSEWDVAGTFESARIGDHGDLAWPVDVDLCADASYLELTNQAPERVFPGLGETASMPELSRC